MRQVSGEDCEIEGASRTDSGANARGQVCHFDVSEGMPEDKWRLVLNQALPNDIAIVSSCKVSPEFNSRFWAEKRWYRYRILTGRTDPERARYTYHYDAKPLDVGLMRDAASHLIGKHDFLAFSQLVPPGKSTVRELFSVEVRRVRDELRIDVIGTAFVRGMMRRISGALWEVGRGARQPDSIPELLGQRDRRKIRWPTVLPANGLTLMKVFYGRHPHDRRRERNSLIGTNDE